ncbi:MAG: serine/threonine-protein phosphatase [Verrucomicrobiota bacterium JB022]|nr:serine/threonine-protein phosphatase [Verrucomicrobiota bacterium JB022]
MKLTSFGISDIGHVRAQNEDRILLKDDLQVYAVADGLGGLPGGSLAAEMTVRNLEDWAREHLVGDKIEFPEIFERINEVVYAEGQRLHPNVGIGSTLTSIRLLGNTLHCGHVGDSAVYLIRRGYLSQLTEEHTLAAELQARMGKHWDEIPDYFFHTLTRCIGQKDAVEVFTCEEVLQKGDRILLSTDGLTKVLTHKQILNSIEAHLSPEAAGRSLIEDALEAGAPDNVSLVLLYVQDV